MSLQQANLMTIEAPKLLVMDTGHPRVAQRSPAPVPIKTCTLGHGYGYLLIWAWVLRGFIPAAGALDGLHGRKTPDSHLQVREMEEWWQWYAASMASHYTGPPCMYSPHPAQKCMPTALRGEQGHATMIRGVREREGEEEEEGEWWW
ncbi:hypothetical protein CPB84DRAFT_1756550 [Gymnopilus junonius]|uniref:Uncharacterized protein n=1 Tax=Gymnopilus junonius TaxID=109634 RepID=A0A9P5N7P0_GYMJU|nr:hypothetical protein CPB84DRAFT_1756550 [Gymnopilus junonius]